MLRPTMLCMATTHSSLGTRMGSSHTEHSRPLASPDPEPEAKAKADAEAYYALYGYYPSWYRGYYGHGLVYGKRSADAVAEPEPEAKAKADAEAYYALYGYYPSWYRGYYGPGLVYGK